MTIGIILAFAGTFLQLISYLFSRAFLGGDGGRSPWLLFNVSHVIVGSCAVIMLLFIWPETAPDISRLWTPYLLSGLLYLTGQISFLAALSATESSRLTPYLALKVIMLALLTMALRGESFTASQWLAIGFSALATAVFNWTGGRLPARALGLVLLAAFGYAASDIFMKDMVTICEPMGIFKRSAFPMCMEYCLCGGLGLVYLFFSRNFRAGAFKAALPTSLIWMTAMMALFSSFGFISVVYSGIIQSTRGVMAVAVGAGVAAMGFGKVEEKVGWPVFARRMLGAALLAAAVVLFHLGADGQ